MQTSLFVTGTKSETGKVMFLCKKKLTTRLLLPVCFFFTCLLCSGQQQLIIYDYQKINEEGRVTGLVLRSYLGHFILGEVKTIDLGIYKKNHLLPGTQDYRLIPVSSLQFLLYVAGYFSAMFFVLCGVISICILSVIYIRIKFRR
jgi:hypothetical protein